MIRRAPAQVGKVTARFVIEELIVEGESLESVNEQDH